MSNTVLGVTQGDPSLSMLLYAVAMMPLVNLLERETCTEMVC